MTNSSHRPIVVTAPCYKSILLAFFTFSIKSRFRGRANFFRYISPLLENQLRYFNFVSCDLKYNMLGIFLPNKIEIESLEFMQHSLKKNMSFIFEAIFLLKSSKKLFCYTFSTFTVNSYLLYILSVLI